MEFKSCEEYVLKKLEEAEDNALAFSESLKEAAETIDGLRIMVSELRRVINECFKKKVMVTDLDRSMFSSELIFDDNELYYIIDKYYDEKE